MLVEVLSRDGEAWADLRRGALIPRLVSRAGLSVHVALTAAGALLLGGDSVELAIRVGAGCTLVLEDVGGTVAYGGSDRLARWSASIDLAPGSCLIWHALPFVVAEGATVERETSVSLTGDAVAYLRETLVLGRQGEAGGTMTSRMDVTTDGRPVFRESLVLDGHDRRIGVLGDHRVMDSALSFGRRHDADLALQLDEPGTIVRALGEHAHLASVERIWHEWVGDPVSA